MGVVIPIMITNAVFMEAEKNGAKWHGDWSKYRSHRFDKKDLREKK
jgi:hypothetical protein